jgi:RNA polymerase sigma-70 factor (ECF subfamily)
MNGSNDLGSDLDIGRDRREHDSAQEEIGRVFIEDLFARHHKEIHAYLLRMLHDPELAADLTQDAFVKAYRAHASLKDPTHARAWLYRIARRVALDHLRHRRLVRFVPWTGESYGAAPSAEHVVMHAGLSAEIRRALDRIPERQRTALVLAELHDLTGLELAAVLGTSHAAVRTLLTRARESLRQALASEFLAVAEIGDRPARVAQIRAVGNLASG